MKLLTQILVTTLSILIVTYLMPHIHVDSPWDALLLSAVLAGLNMLVRPVLILITLPITILTMGLFLFIVNGINILIADYLMDGFRVDGLWWAVLFSILLTVVNSILENFLGTNKSNNPRQR